MKSRNRRLGIYQPNLFRYEVRIVVAGEDPDKTIVRIIAATNDYEEAQADLYRMSIFKTNCHIYDNRTQKSLALNDPAPTTDAGPTLAP